MNLEQLKKNGLKVGKNFRPIFDVFIDRSHTHHIEIGDDVTISSKASILAHDAAMLKHLGHVEVGKVKIGNKVFIGFGSIILPGTVIGDNCIIGAGSVVKGVFPEGTVISGNPAKVKMSLEEYKSKKRDVISSKPIFDSSYTYQKDMSDCMKDEMNEIIEDIGYIKVGK